MKTIYLHAPFDPISEAEVQAACLLSRENGVKEVILAPEADGTADKTIRFRLLKLALKPYRNLSAADTVIPESVRMKDEWIDTEARVRGGSFRLAAHGIRALLAEETWYLDTALDHCCKPRRAVHSRSVAEVCRTLAEAHGLDPVQAWKAGMMHDMTKAWTTEQSEALLRVYAPEILSYDPPVYHSYTCPIFLKQELGIQDHAILEAIREHTLGTCHSNLSKILYIADKIEPTRGYDVTEETELAMKDLDRAFQLVFREAELYRERKSNG